MRRYPVRSFGIFADVAPNNVTVAKILRVRLLRICIPLRSEHTLPANTFESQPQTADTSEEVNKTKWSNALKFTPPLFHSFAQYAHTKWRGLGAPIEISVNCALAYFEKFRHFIDSKPPSGVQLGELVGFGSCCSHESPRLCRFSTSCQNLTQGAMSCTCFVPVLAWLEGNIRVGSLYCCLSNKLGYR